MAACDNLYGNIEQWKELHKFLSEKKPEFLKNMKEKPDSDEDGFRICYIPDIQKWLIKNCQFDWVKSQLEDNFDIQRMICGKAHHE